jgi:hypothetical protein
MNNASSSEPSFQLSSGGLLRQIRQRIRRLGAGDVSILTQFLIAISVLWLPLVVLTLIEGTFIGDGVAQPFVQDVVPQVRFLIALPLLLLADLAIDPAVGSAIRTLERSGVVPDNELPRYQAALVMLEKGRDSIWPDVVMLVLAFGFTWLFQPGYGESAIQTANTSWLWSVSDRVIDLRTAGWWYVLVSAPFFVFILFRWIWRFLIWAGFLYRVSRIPLALQPTHPDFAGGLGILGLTQQTFSIFFVALATVMSSTMAHNILYEGDTFQESRPEIIVFIVVCVVLIYAPLLSFAKNMYSARRIGLNQYGALGYRLSDAFFAKWITGAGSNVGEELKNSTDPSAMADYGATFDAVRNMRVIPVTLRGVLAVAAALAVPFLPLYLTEFSIIELLQRVGDSLV